MNRVIIRGLVVEAETLDVPQTLFDLCVDVAPLAHAHVGEVVRSAESAKLVLRAAFHLVVIGVPDVEVGEEVAAVVVELLVDFVGFGLLFQRPFARILNADGGSDNEHFGKSVLLPSLQQHP